MQGSGSRSVLARVYVVCRAHERLDALSHVVQALEQLLDDAHRWTLADAASAGYVHLMARLKARTLHPLIPQVFADVMRVAASSGSLAAVQWLSLQVEDGVADGALESAAFAGHLEVVQWLYAKQQNAIRLRVCSIEGLQHAAEMAQLNAFQWMYPYPYEDCYGSTFAMDGAATNGHLHVLEWLHLHTPMGCTTNAMDGAARNGHLQVVQWLHLHRSEGCEKWAMDGAAMNGHLKIVQWLHENRQEGCTTDAMDFAALFGHLEVVQWLHANRHEGCTSARYAAASKGHTHVVQWLKEHQVVHHNWLWRQWTSFTYLEFSQEHK